MADPSVQAWLDDIGLLDANRHALVQAVRAALENTLAAVSEEIKYGGLLFTTSRVRVGGVFAYSSHVTVEFSHGAAIVDPFGHLQGTGKYRRHLKLTSIPDIQRKQLTHYLCLAFEAASAQVR